MRSSRAIIFTAEAMARLKVYTAEIGGLHEWIVAAPSQKAAAAAWGVDADVFSRGGGHVTSDEAATKAALARPGTALRRLKGKGAYKPVSAADDVESWALAAKAADAEPAPKDRAKGVKTAKSSTKAATRPSRAALDRAEKALDAFDAEAFEARKALDDERAKLDAREAALEDRLDQRRATLTAARDKARAAYDKAGG